MKLKNIFSIVAAIAMVTAPGLTFASSAGAGSSIGTNVADANGTVYLVTTENGQTVRRPYTSAGAFLSYGFNTWSGVSHDSAALQYPVGSFIPPQDGKIICSDRGSDKGTCYLITDSQKAGFVSESIFKGLGYSFGRAMYGDVSFLPTAANIDSTTQPHKPGTLINLNNTVYLVTGNGLLGFPDISIFNSWGYSFADVVTANSADSYLVVKNTVPAKAPGLLNPHTTDNTPPPVVQNNMVAALHTASPSGNITPGTGKDLLRFTITAPQNGSVTLRELGFDFPNPMATAALSNLKLINNATNAEVGSNSGNTLTSNSVLINLTSGIGLTGNSTADFTLRADVGPSASGSTMIARLTQIWTGDSGIAGQADNVTGLPVAGNPLTVGASAPLMMMTQTANETWVVGSQHTIAWQGGTSSDKVNISLTPCSSIASCSGNLYYIARGISNTGSFSWTVTQTDLDSKQIPSGYLGVVVDDTTSSVGANSAALVTIASGTYVQLVSPRNGDTWIKGGNSTIQFSTSGVTSINVYLLPYPTCTNTSGVVSCGSSSTIPFRVAQNVSTGYTGVGVLVSRDVVDSRDIPTGQYLVQISDSSGTYTDTSPLPITLQ